MKYAVSHKQEPQEYRRRQSLERRAKNPIGYLLNQCRYRAKKAGEEFSIVLEDLEIPDRCPIYDIPLYFTPGKRTDNSYSLDRRDNTKGYVKDNVFVISWKANMMKGDMSIQDVERLLNYMKG